MAHGSFDHLKSSRQQWWIVIISGLLTLIFGTLGVWQYEHAHPIPGNGPFVTFLLSLYHALQMLILHTPHFEEQTNLWLEAGRWCGAFTLVITTLMLLWRRLWYEFKLFQLLFWVDHYIVCGLSQRGLEIVRHRKRYNPQSKTSARGVHVVVIDPAPEDSLVEECARLGVPVLLGDATEERWLKQARVSHAREVFVITPADETNVRIAVKVRELSNRKKTPGLNCFVHLHNIHLRERLQKLLPEKDGGRNCALKFFDVFDNEAREILLKLPLDGNGIAADDPRTVHVVIVGFGRMGRSLALRAARLGHFANRKPLRISVIDRRATQQREHFLFRHPVLGKPDICHLDFHEADAESLTARQWIEQWADEPEKLVRVFVCLDDNTHAVEAGLRFQEALAKKPDSKLCVRLKTYTSLATILKSGQTIGPSIEVFGMVEDTCGAGAFCNVINEDASKLSHEDFVNRRGADSRRTPENDPALRSWDELTEDLRDSSREQNDHIGIKLRAMGCETAPLTDSREAVTEFSVADTELLAEVEHTRWNAERWLAGWHYGTLSDKPKRVSEHLKPWNELDDSIKKYDREAVTGIFKLLATAKPPLKVVRQKSGVANTGRSAIKL